MTLVYYIAYYLPAALAGKILGPAWGNSFLFLWTILGIAIAVLWFLRLIGEFSIKYLILFIMFSGLDSLGYLLVNGSAFSGITHIEWWASLFQYSSNTSQLFWVPQHAIPAWIITPLILHEMLNIKSNRLTLFILSLGALWSPFVMLGLIPYILISLYRCRFKEIFSFQNLAASPMILLSTGAFYLSKISQEKGEFLWNSTDLYSMWPMLIMFYLLEFGLYAIFCRPSASGHKLLWGTSVVCLLIIPLYRIGVWNDFAMRVSIPSLFVLLIFLTSVLKSQDSRKQWLIIALIIGSVTAGCEIARSINYTAILKDKNSYLVEMQVTQIPLRNQYLGSLDSFFFRYLSK